MLILLMLNKEYYLKPIPWLTFPLRKRVSSFISPLVASGQFIVLMQMLLLFNYWNIFSAQMLKSTRRR